MLQIYPNIAQIRLSDQKAKGEDEVRERKATQGRNQKDEGGGDANEIE
jgi:hypothetical protein|tara:strand:+ start:152 stop:295 length:144 start_codon:yes stop_codon:yes gene_type:complete